MSGSSILAAWRDKPILQKLVLWAGLAVMLVLMVRHNIDWSLKDGRLATVPRYDDITYLNDGTRRLAIAKASGIGAFLEDFFQWPAHAPMSTLTAMLGFELFGPGAKSAYLANAWIFAAYIAVMAYISRPLKNVLARLLFVAVWLFAPVGQAIITEFRPDMAAGLAFAVALAAITSADWAHDTRGRRLMIALLAVCATVAKPSGSVVAIPGFGIAWLGSVVLQATIGKTSPILLLRKSGFSIVAYIVMLSPFVYFWGETTVLYIYQTLVGNADIWKTEGTPLFHLAYHFSGLGGTQALWPFGGIGLALILIDLGVLVFAGSTRERVSAFALTATLIVLYGAMAISAEKTPYQGSYFYLPFLIAVALAVIRLLVKAREALQSPWLAPVALAGTLGALAVGYPLASSYTALPPNSAELPPLLDRLAERVVQSIAARPADSPCANRTPKVMFVDTDPMSPDTAGWAVLERGVTVNTDASFLERTQEAVNDHISSADFVVIPNPGMPGLFSTLPGIAFRASTLERLQKDPDFQGEVVGTVGGFPLWLFQPLACMASKSS